MARASAAEQSHVVPAVKDQVRWTVIFRFYRCFIESVGYRPCTESLIEGQPPPVLLQGLLIFAQQGIIRKTFEEETDGIKRDGLLPYPFIQCTSKTGRGTVSDAAI
jgi:hypothetical protein